MLTNSNDVLVHGALGVVEKLCEDHCKYVRQDQVNNYIHILKMFIKRVREIDEKISIFFISMRVSNKEL